MIAGPIYRKYEKAIRGVWNAKDLDYSQDAADWQRIDDAQRRGLLGVTVRFLAGEQAVTDELVPMLAAAHHPTVAFRARRASLPIVKTAPGSASPHGGSQKPAPLGSPDRHQDSGEGGLQGTPPRRRRPREQSLGRLEPRAAPGTFVSASWF